MRTIALLLILASAASANPPRGAVIHHPHGDRVYNPPRRRVIYTVPLYRPKPRVIIQKETTVIHHYHHYREKPTRHLWVYGTGGTDKSLFIESPFVK